jgi:hypothetical protein
MLLHARNSVSSDGTMYATYSGFFVNNFTIMASIFPFVHSLQLGYFLHVHVPCSLHHHFTVGFAYCHHLPIVFLLYTQIKEQ